METGRVETFKLFYQADTNSRLRGEMIGCFATLELAKECAKEMGLIHFSIKLNNAESWEW